MARSDLVRFFPSSFAALSPDVAITASKLDPAILHVASVDFFTPVSQSPFKFGFIAAANALSDLYAVGVTQIDQLLMVLCLPSTATAETRAILAAEIVKGFNAACNEADVVCLGGQTILNPWPIVGGAASTLARKDDLLDVRCAAHGDLLILTKPLGTQVAANLAVWTLSAEKWPKVVEAGISETEATRIVLSAENWMMKLNKKAALAAKAAKASACTDITGYGLVGHAENLVNVQLNAVDFVFSNLVVLRGLTKIEKGITIDYKLTQGRSAETSGGLLIAVSPSRLAKFATAMEEEAYWIVGHVQTGTRQIIIQENVKILETE